MKKLEKPVPFWADWAFQYRDINFVELLKCFHWIHESAYYRKWEKEKGKNIGTEKQKLLRKSRAGSTAESRMNRKI